MATTGCGYAGATALILSNAKLDQAEAADGHIVDLVLPQSFATGKDGVERIAAMLEAFSATGGMCLHLNCFSAEMLRDAVKNPAKYADMQVRICGWNVRWGELSKSERERFLKTAEAQEN
jgi:formate C-acetyltransferase